MVERSFGGRACRDPGSRQRWRASSPTTAGGRADLRWSSGPSVVGLVETPVSRQRWRASSTDDGGWSGGPSVVERSFGGRACRDPGFETALARFLDRRRRVVGRTFGGRADFGGRACRDPGRSSRPRTYSVGSSQPAWTTSTPRSRVTSRPRPRRRRCGLRLPSSGPSSGLPGQHQPRHRQVAERLDDRLVEGARGAARADGPQRRGGRRRAPAPSAAGAPRPVTTAAWPPGRSRRPGRTPRRRSTTTRLRSCSGVTSGPGIRLPR